MKTFVTAFALLGLALAPAAARELASAPEVAIIGFSPDGRHFAYEQYENADVSDAAIAAIDVIDRTSGASAKGFPFGFLGVSKGGEFPLKVGGHKIKKDESDEVSGDKKLATLRAAVRRQTAARLKALKIGEPGRRLAGRTITDRSASKPEVEFVLGPTLPGPVPDMQPIYRASASFAPNDHETCVQDSKAADHTIKLKIDQLHPRDETVEGTTTAEIAWPAGENECAQTVRITDVIAPPPSTGDGPSFVVVIALAISWGGHSETSRYFASFVKLP